MIFLLKEQTILQAITSFDMGKFAQGLLGYIFLIIDSIVYFFVNKAYTMYLALAQFKLFDNETFQDLITRTYIIIGVISLFIVAYALINSIINPDNASKGDKSLSKIVKNIVFSIIGIAVVPTIFNYFYYFQRVILCNNLIPKIFMAYNTENSENNNFLDDDVGPQFATYLFQSFFYPTAIENKQLSDVSDGNALIADEASKVTSTAIDILYPTDDGLHTGITTYSLQDAYDDSMNGKSFFTTFRLFLIGEMGVASGDVQYLFILSTIAGIYCAYVLANLCIDMAVRAVKLGYLELIAPLPIMTIIVPGKKSVFDNWLKKTISCALEVFVRLFVVVFVIYLIRTIPNLFTATTFSYGGCTTSFGVITALLIRALVYCGLLTFVKQAPKFFSEATGIKSDGFKLGIADKLGEMALIGGAAKNGVQSLQGAATGAIGGLTTGFFNRDKINIKSAVMQGATQGFKGKGNQFSNQRKSTFQSIGGYEDKDQDIFGGESVVSKFINDHKKDVKNNYTEHGTQYKQKFAKEGEMKRLKSEDNFSLKAHDKRKETFENGDINQAAKSYSEKKAEVAGVTSEEAKQQYRLEYLNNVMNTTTDVGVRRRIQQYLNELDADKRVYNEIRALDEDSEKAWEKFKYSDEQISQEIENLTKSKSEKQRELEREQLAAKSTLLDAAQRAAAASRAEKIEKEIKDIDAEIEVYNKLPNLKFTFDVTANNLAESVILGNGTLDMVSGIDYKKTLTDVEQKRVDAYRGFDAGVEAATKTVDTQDQLLEEIRKMNKNSGQK